ncbi:putative threonine aldolase [Filobasidium floriforme]|uniref:putative threonine aldolase n=1 Tax=Filobasidium floriforme TaxID=5210 RepID=UPI001E8EE060|nr:putative threonine aldolase [Filobasidium floriforme]KAH8090382.1 putative threonine aldolase [Filobasidium floriforme]
MSASISTRTLLLPLRTTFTLRPLNTRTFATIMPVAVNKASISADVGGQHNVDQLAKISRDFRSDTITVPTDSMLVAGIKASRGDDVYRDDPATIELENRIANLTGKEAGLFLVSGTMSNQLAIRSTLAQPPHSVITDHRAHVHQVREAGGIAVFSQATTHALPPRNGHHLTLEDDILPNLQLGNDIHTAPTRLICLENTLAGTVFPQDEIVKISEEAAKHDIIMHLDGARIWEVAARVCHERGLPMQDEGLGIALKELCAPFNTISLCLSKGIGAPIGSVLVGPKPLIERARWFRKMFGGGIRQSGAIATAASVALTEHFPKLIGTHGLARKLADGVQALGGKFVYPTETNMVWVDLASLGIPLKDLQAAGEALEQPLVIRGARFVVHHQITEQAIDDLLILFKELQDKHRAKQGDLDAINEKRPQEKLIAGQY